MNCAERLTTNCLPVSPSTENMCCMSFFLSSRLHHRTTTYGRASITSNFLIKLVISQIAILCSACYFSIPTDVPSSRVIFILFHSSIHLSFSHTFKYCTLCVLTKFNKNTWWWLWIKRERIPLVYMFISGLFICMILKTDSYSKTGRSWQNKLINKRPTDKC